MRRVSKVLDIINNPNAQPPVAHGQAEETTVSEAFEEAEKEEIQEEGQLDLPNALYVQDCIPLSEDQQKVFGNKIRLVFEGAYYPDNFEQLYDNIDFTTPFTYDPEVSDNFRFAAQKYWYNRGNKTIEWTKFDFAPTQQVPFEIRIREAEMLENNTIPSMEQIVQIIPDKGKFQNSSGVFDRLTWSTYVNGGEIGQHTFEPLVELGPAFNDHVFDTFIPTNDELASLTKKASITANYNFNIKEYEAVATFRGVDERIMPNVYAMIAHLENGAGNEHVKSLNRLDGLLENILVPKSDGEPITFRDNAQYFNEWARNAGNVSETWVKEIRRRFSDIVFSAEEIENELLELAEVRENIYPASIQIDFSTDPTTEFTQILKDSRFSKNFNMALARDLISDRNDFDTHIEDKLFGVHQNMTAVNPVRSASEHRTWDVTSWWTRLEQKLEAAPSIDLEAPIQNETLNPDVGFGLDVEEETQQTQTESAELVQETQPQPFSVVNPLGPGDFGTFLDAFPDMKEQDEYDSFYGQLLRIIFAGKMRKFIKKHMRDYCAILNGRKCYSEPVLYRISKHSVLPNGIVFNEPKQNFYIPNTNDINDVSFFDTQVKYGLKYVYKIWAYHLVVGNQYFYEPIGKKGKQKGNVISLDPNGVAKFKVRNLPKLMLVEVEETTFDPIRLLDDPPLPPLAEFIPYIGKDNKIAISLCNAVGETRLEPIAIEPDDQDEIDSILRKQNSEDGLIRYAGDDSVARFEVFRTRFHPSNYEDFTDNKIAVVSTELASGGNRNTSEVTFVDEIRPNTKYYYIFRSIDIHGHTSNPTEIYEVELVNNSGAIYPLIQTVDFLRKKEKIPTKSFKKYLRIKVADPQKVINLEKSRLSGITRPITKAPDYVALGTRDESVWGRKFKLRITSKSSGKKIDINFVFDSEVKEFKASSVELDDQVITNPESIAQILGTLETNK